MKINFPGSVPVYCKQGKPSADGINCTCIEKFNTVESRDYAPPRA